MSQNKQKSEKSSEMRKSPLSSQKLAHSKSSKTKLAKGKPSSKSTGDKPVSNGLREVTNGVPAKDETAKMNLLTLQKTDSGVSSILATVPHVVLYRFKTSENVWVSGGE